jgi:hypothetical protein
LHLYAEESSAAKPAGRVLVLDNERTLEGDIERQADQYHIRRAVGELWVPTGSVLRLCKNFEEAYAFLRSRANLNDPDEHLRLAHWCQLHGLRSQAISEVTEAVELRPNHGESRRLLHNLQRCATLQTNGEAHPPRSAEETGAGQNPPSINTESLSLFVTRVQPILMNACANCHATGRGGSFKLMRTYETGLGSRRATHQNLAAVLGQVNQDHLQASQLLTKAVSVHGDMVQPALKGREAAAYRALEEWLRVTVGSNPQVHERASMAMIPLGAPEPVGGTSLAPGKPEAVAEPATASKPQAGKPGQATTAPSIPEAAGQIGKASPAPGAAEPVDPFDPVIFNRQMHPPAKK